MSGELTRDLSGSHIYCFRQWAVGLTGDVGFFQLSRRGANHAAGKLSELAGDAGEGQGRGKGFAEGQGAQSANRSKCGLLHSVPEGAGVGGGPLHEPVDDRKSVAEKKAMESRRSEIVQVPRRNEDVRLACEQATAPAVLIGAIGHL